MAACVALLTLAPRTSSAQTFSDWKLDFSSAVPVIALVGLGGLYVVGGTATFLTLDLVKVGKNKPFPPALAWLQAGYGASVVGLGLLSLDVVDLPALSYPVIIGGAALAFVPLLEWSLRSPNASGGSQTPGVAVYGGPASLFVAGQF